MYFGHYVNPYPTHKFLMESIRICCVNNEMLFAAAPSQPCRQPCLVGCQQHDVTPLFIGLVVFTSRNNNGVQIIISIDVV